MKNYKALVPIALVLLLAASWYMLIKKTVQIDNSYNKYLNEARRWASEGVIQKSIDNYKAALKVNETPEVYAEVADVYDKENLERNNLAWCKKFLDKYPTFPQAYDCLLRVYYKDADYKKCYDVITAAKKRKIETDYINSISEQIKNEYMLDYSSFSDVGVFSNNLCAVCSKGLWGYINRYGVQRVDCSNLEANPYTNDKYASVVNEKNEAYFIDEEGRKAFNPEGYESFGLMVGGVFAAKIADGRYVYVREKISSGDSTSDGDESNYEEVSGEFEYAATMNMGVAAVKKDGSWCIINDKYEVIKSGYADIKLDEKQIACRNDRMFVANESGQYIMVDSGGNQIGSSTYEDACVFGGDAPTAVKIDGKWRFINKDGAFISDKTYDEARAFCCEMAAVCIDGKWGFVDSDENIVIEPQYFGAKDFNEKGSCFVKTGDKWQLLKIYRLNRED